MQFRPYEEDHYGTVTEDQLYNKTGFGENYVAALGLTITEDLPIVSRFIPSIVESERTKKILDYHKQGLVSDEILNYYDGDTDGLVYYARNELGLTDLPSKEDYEKALKEEYKIYRNYSEDVFAHSNFLGKIGAMAGTAHAYTLDPLYAVSAFTGYGTAATVAQAFVNAAVVESTISAVAQPFKIQWKHRIGADYDATDAIKDVVFTGLTAGVISGAGKYLKNVLSPSDLTVGDGLNFFRKVAKDSPENANAIKPLMTVLESEDPKKPLGEALKANEDIDRAVNKVYTNTEKPFDPEMFKREEERFNKWAGEKEGVPHGTPSDYSSQLLDNAVKDVKQIEETLSIIEECF